MKGTHCYFRNAVHSLLLQSFHRFPVYNTILQHSPSAPPFTYVLFFPLSCNISIHQFTKSDIFYKNITDSTKKTTWSDPRSYSSHLTDSTFDMMHTYSHRVADTAYDPSIPRSTSPLARSILDSDKPDYGTCMTINLPITTHDLPPIATMHEHIRKVAACKTCPEVPYGRKCWVCGRERFCGCPDVPRGYRCRDCGKVR